MMLIGGNMQSSILSIVENTICDNVLISGVILVVIRLRLLLVY